MFDAASTILFDRTESECNPPAIYRACGRYTRAGRYAFYNTPNPEERQTVPYRLRSTLRSSLMPRSLLSGRPKYTRIESSVQRPSDNKTQKWRRRQNGRSADGIAYVAYNYAMGNLTDRSWSQIKGWSSVPSSQVLDLRQAHDTRNDKRSRLLEPSARDRVYPWISRSRVDSGVNPARRGARIRGQ